MVAVLQENSGTDFNSWAIFEKIEKILILIA